MTESMIVSIVSMLGTLVGTFAGILTSAKLSNYRIEQLEKKVEQFNNFSMRIVAIETDLKNIKEGINHE